MIIIIIFFVLLQLEALVCMVLFIQFFGLSFCQFFCLFIHLFVRPSIQPSSRCECSFSEVIVSIAFIFSRIILKDMQLIISFRHFDSSFFRSYGTLSLCPLRSLVRQLSYLIGLVLVCVVDHIIYLMIFLGVMVLLLVHNVNATPIMLLVQIG